MHNFFSAKQLSDTTTPFGLASNHCHSESSRLSLHPIPPLSPAELAFFSSNDDPDGGCEADDEDEDEDDSSRRSQTEGLPTQSNHLLSIPPLKQQHLEVLACALRAQKQQTREKELKEALVAIKKLLRSKKMEFSGGNQDYRHTRHEQLNCFFLWL